MPFACTIVEFTSFMGGSCLNQRGLPSLVGVVLKQLQNYEHKRGLHDHLKHHNSLF